METASRLYFCVCHHCTAEIVLSFVPRTSKLCERCYRKRICTGVRDPVDWLESGSSFDNLERAYEDTLSTID